MLYHGSPRKVRVLYPRHEHGDPDIGERVFAAPSRMFALAYTGKKWGDRDMGQSMQYHDASSTSADMHLHEMRPGALKDIYGGQKGYLYHLSPEGFSRVPGRTSRLELVSPHAVHPLHIEQVQDVYETLLAHPLVHLIPYDPSSKETLLAVRRTVARMWEMAPQKAAMYKRWRLENAPPEMRVLFQRECHFADSMRE